MKEVTARTGIPVRSKDRRVQKLQSGPLQHERMECLPAIRSWFKRAFRAMGKKVPNTMTYGG